MKKRKILVSLALASACLFSLASCGKDEASTTTTTAPAQTTTTTVAPATTTTTAPAQTTTTTTAPAQTTTTTAAQTTTTTTTAAATEYDVKYYAVYSDGTDEEQLTDLNCKVAKNGKATQPTAPTKTGYEFRGFKNYNTEEPFDFANTGITKNTKIAVFYYKPTAYDTMAASTNTNKVFATDFSDKTPQTSIAAYSADAGVYNEKDADASKNYAEYFIHNYQNALKTYDKGSAQTKVNVNFGSEITDSTVRILTTFQLDGTVVAGSWPFIEFSEKKNDGTNMIIGFGYNGEKKIGYRIGSDYSLLKDAAFEAGVDYELITEIDTNAGTVKFTLNGVELGTANVACENVAGMKFVTAGSAGTYDSHADERIIIVKNIAVEAAANSVDDIKTAAKADIQALYDAYEDSDKPTGFDTIWTNFVDAAKTSVDSAIEAATTVAEVKAAKEDGLATIETVIKALRTQYIGSIGFSSLPQWSYANNASQTIKDIYEAADSTKQGEYNTALAELKDKYIDTTTYVEACIPADRFDSSKDKLYVKDGDNYVALESTATYDATATYYIKLQLKYKKGETLVPNAAVTTLKELLECYNQFVADAEDLVAEKVDVTVKYYTDATTPTEITSIATWVAGKEYYVYDYEYTKATVADETAFNAGTFYKAVFVYEEAGSITSWAKSTDYFTEDGGVYTKVDQSTVTKPAEGVTYYTRRIGSYEEATTYSSTSTYYTRSADKSYQKVDTSVIKTPETGVTYYAYVPVEVTGSEKTIKVVKDGVVEKAQIADITGYFTVDYYGDAAFNQKFDFTKTISDNTTVVCVYVKTKLSLDITKISNTAVTTDTLVNDLIYITSGVKSEDVKIDGLKNTYSTQLSLTGGKAQVSSGVNKNAIKITFDKDVNVKMAVASKSDKTVKIAVLNAAGEDASANVSGIKKDGTAATAFDNASKTTAETYEFTLKAGTYLIGGSGGGLYVYSFEVTLA